MKKQFKIFILLIVVFAFWSCNKHKSELYINDKTHIEKAFISNVEAVRRYKLSHNDSLEKRPFDISLYDDYAGYDINNKSYVVPRPACEWLEVEVGSISYSRDSLKCVALVTVKDNSPLFLHPEEDNQIGYDAYPIIGVRNSKDKQFRIYPILYVHLKGFKFRREALAVLKQYYHRSIPSDDETGNYPCSINNPDFFEKSCFFYKVRYIYDKSLFFSKIPCFNMYWCEVIRTRDGKIEPLIYYSNQDSTITKYLCGE